MKKRAALILMIFACLIGGAFHMHKGLVLAGAHAVDYRVEMIHLIDEMHAYAKKENAKFLFVSNNGLGLFSTADGVKSAQADQALAAIDGILMEDYFYGWDMRDNNPTPKDEQNYRLELLQYPKEKGVPIFNIDYCSTREYRERSYRKNHDAGFIGFAAGRRQLDSIPNQIQEENDRDCQSLGEVKNYLVLLNPEQFKSKEAYLSALRNTNYDLLIVDMMYNGELLAKQDVESLKMKANGKKRLVLSYMSVGEAENYRAYWQPEWDKNRPNWLDAENGDWEGDFKVKYWLKEWQELLYGSKNSYLDQILSQGFDGAFLDVVDAYEYFETKRDTKK